MKIGNGIKNFFCSHLMAVLIWPFGSVVLSWDRNKEPDLMGYKVYYGLNSREYHAVFDVGNVTRYTITDLTAGARYYFAVTAYDHAGNESGYSNEVSVAIDEDDNTNLSVASYNFPNPFDPTKEITRLRYFLKGPGKVTIKIYDVNNMLVKTFADGQEKSPGEHLENYWDGRNNEGRLVANGIYYCRLMTEEYASLIKIAVSR